MNIIVKFLVLGFAALFLTGCLATIKTIGLEQGVAEIDCSIGSEQLANVKDRIRAHEGAKELKEAGLGLGALLALTGVGIPAALGTVATTLGAVTYPMSDLYAVRDKIKEECSL